MSVIPYIKWDESHTSMISLFKLCLIPFKSLWMTPWKYWSSLPSPGLVSLTARPPVPNSGCLLMAENCLSPVAQEDELWMSLLELWVRAHGATKQLSKNKLSFIFTYRDLQSFADQRVRPVLVHIGHSPETLREAQMSLPGSRQATKSPLAHPQISLSITALILQA